MTTPDTPAALFSAFQRFGYRSTIRLYGAAPLSEHFAPRDIVAIAWEVSEVDERSNLRRRRHLEALLSAASHRDRGQCPRSTQPDTTDTTP